jgi:hypothetical protein
LIAAVLLGGCSSGKDAALAGAQIPGFRQLMAEQKFEEIYDAAADDLKRATTRQDMVALLAAVDRKLGPVKSTQQVKWNVNFRTSGTFVTLGFKTQFERGDGNETFVYRVEDDKALLAGYHINSNALITN